MTLPEAASIAMQQTNQRFAGAIAQRNLDALGEVYTASARILPPGADLIQGRDAIQAFWQKALDSLGIQSMTLTTVALEACGDSAVEIGRAAIRLADGNTVESKYIVHWKQEDGQWKWDKDIWNRN